MLTVVIQAGGESRRMGQDKALLPFLGKPLIQRVIERVASLADELLVTTNRPEAYQFLDLPLFPDVIPGRGALGGLYTALSAASQPLVAVVACDMPFASPALLMGRARPAACHEQRRRHPADGGWHGALPCRIPAGGLPVCHPGCHRRRPLARGRLVPAGEALLNAIRRCTGVRPRPDRLLERQYPRGAGSGGGACPAYRSGVGRRGAHPLVVSLFLNYGD